MFQISTNDAFNGFHASACTLCRYYLLATHPPRGGARSTVHVSRTAAIRHAEISRARGVRFTLIEMPALFFSCDRHQPSLLGSSGLLITESTNCAPMAAHGAVSIDRLDVRSIIAQFLRQPERLFVRRTEADMPALCGPLRAWSSESIGSRRPLAWCCVNKCVAFDLSHLESLRMRLDQQIRNLNAASVASHGG
jgi:hypothetical protein